MSLEQTADVQDLIVVPGHAPFRRSVRTLPEDLEGDAPWCLAPYQAGEPPFYLQHIGCGLELALQQPQALLVFSGGVTREAGGWSEGATYRAVAERRMRELARERARADLARRVDVEVGARDSWENLLLSVLRFHELRARFPRHVAVVGWAFKRARFDLHRASIRWPGERYTYIGVNDPPDVASAAAGEAETRAAFERYPFGTRGPAAAKRARRSFGRPPGSEAASAWLAFVYDPANAARRAPSPPWSA